MKLKRLFSRSLAMVGLSAFAFSGAAIAYSGDDYLRTLNVEPVEIAASLSKDQKEQFLEDLSWIHFSMVDALPKRTNVHRISDFASSQDAQSIIERSPFTQQAWLRLSTDKSLAPFIKELEGDGVFSVQDALIFSKSAAKALYPKP